MKPRRPAAHIIGEDNTMTEQFDQDAAGSAGTAERDVPCD